MRGQQGLPAPMLFTYGLHNRQPQTVRQAIDTSARLGGEVYYPLQSPGAFRYVPAGHDYPVEWLTGYW